jgi:DNA repair protein RadC
MTDRQRLLSLMKGDPELVSRLLMVAEDPTTRPLVTSPDVAARHLAPLLAGFDHERFAVLGVDRRRRVIGSQVLTVGNDGFVIVDPRQVYRWALLHKADAVIVAHNHPSGDTTPSHQDVDVTRRLARAGEAIGIPLLDHLVVCGPHRWASLAERGHVPATSSAPMFA